MEMRDCISEKISQSLILLEICHSRQKQMTTTRLNLDTLKYLSSCSLFILE